MLSQGFKRYFKREILRIILHHLISVGSWNTVGFLSYTFNWPFSKNDNFAGIERVVIMNPNSLLIFHSLSWIFTIYDFWKKWTNDKFTSNSPIVFIASTKEIYIVNLILNVKFRRETNLKFAKELSRVFQMVKIFKLHLKIKSEKFISAFSHTHHH